MSPQRTVVIGNGMVGHRFVQELRQRDPHARLTVICEEPRLAYDRVHLSQYLDDPRPDLSLASAATYAQQQIEVHFARATRIDRQARRVHTSAGELPYDTLVLATGSAPFVPPIAGRDAPGCFVYRTIEDLEGIAASAAQARAGVVIGGGLLGLEAAGALRKLGLETHVVEFAPRLMPAQVDDDGARLLRARIEAMGIRVHTATLTEEIETHGGRVSALRTREGARIPAELVVFSAGIRPRDELARACGLRVGERGGIEIDDTCRTSDPAIYAIGECALHRGRVYGLVAPGYRMARVAAEQLGGGSATFDGADTSTKLKLLGVDVGSFGDAFAQTPGAQAVTVTDLVNGTYRKLVVNADGTRLLGGILVGDTAEYGALLELSRAGQALPGPAVGLLVPSAAQPLPAPQTVCSCENVSRAVLEDAIASGARDLSALKGCTRAGTTCGGCVPAMQRVLRDELTRLGEAVSEAVCEHFDHTRQELFDLVRVRGYRSFDQLLAAHGRGLGCEVCKPLVGSILASVWNEHVLEPRHVPLQDTNDAYLANMQRDGTYSVVPRVPGGEITPEKLIVLGEVASKYRLYCKITGGQRIDLFGARVEQLPLIWAELVAAGFESGHAYGKSLRTVKSCVGAAWCRYGVQDSTGLAVRLEERYRGLRAPHKLKGGVSGCARECAEAQGKDFGVIATERGWNLYVCGNGGMKPQHAQLLASDLDEATLVRYLDRFLMFYIRTAGRLERTSTWLNSLQGGMEYLRAVVVHDTLGVAAELEAAMARHVETYACEWRATLDDPRKLARFRSFVNSRDGDPGIAVVTERGQPRPAFEHELPLLPML